MYRFGVDVYTIPADKSRRELTRTALRFIQQQEIQERLCIIYYDGYSMINEGRLVSWYTCAPSQSLLLGIELGARYRPQQWEVPEYRLATVQRLFKQ